MNIRLDVDQSTVIGGAICAELHEGKHEPFAGSDGSRVAHVSSEQLEFDVVSAPLVRKIQLFTSAINLSGEIRQKLDAIDWERPVLRRANRRPFIEAVLIVSLEMGYWNLIPACYGNYHAIYMRFARWVERDAWGPVIAALEGTEWVRPLQRLIRKKKDSIEKRRRLRAVRRKARGLPAAPPADRTMYDRDG